MLVSRKIHIVSLANLIARVTGYGVEETPFETSLLSHPSAIYLSMTDIKLTNLRIDAEEKFEDLLDTRYVNEMTK